MRIEVLIVVENQKFWVSPTVQRLWDEFESTSAPDVEVWAVRLKKSLKPDMFNEFVSLLLAKQAEEEHHRAMYRAASRRCRRR